jgi:hypothetical protein
VFFMRQEEMACIGLQGGLITLYVRHTGRGPTAVAAPLFDLDISEKLGLLLAFLISLVLGFYVQTSEIPFAEPPAVQTRKVKIIFDSPVRKSKAPVQISEPIRSEAAPAPRASAPFPPRSTAPSKNRPPKAESKGFLQALNSQGLASRIDQALNSGGELSDLAGTGAQPVAIPSAPGIKETSSGRDGQTVTVGALGGRRGGGQTGYSKVGGLASKGPVQITVEGQSAGFTAGMDREGVRRVIQEHLNEIRSCYERELQRSPDLYGKLVLQWDIEEGGRVTNASTKSNLMENQAVAECLVGRLKTWRFPNPPPNQIGRVSYPFVFSSH